MSEDSRRLAERLNTTLQSQSEGLFLGDRSLVALSLRDTGSSLELCRDSLLQVMKSRALLLVLSCTETTFPNDIQAMASGLIAALNVAISLQPGSSALGDAARDATLKQQLETAIKCFDCVWSRGEQPVDRARNPARDELIDPTHAVEKACSLLTGTYPATGYWIVRDLLDRWITQKRTPELVPAARSMTTPILGADDGGAGGAVLWLTVELIPCENGLFCPDPVFLGLTSITDSVRENDLCWAMQEVWEASGLSPWFRGRWRIESSNPQDSHGNSAALEIKHFYGRSLQAAALCALLAASGDPYREDEGKEPTGDPDPLVLNVAISATLGSRDLNKPLIEMPLGEVGNVPAKLDEARNQYEMDTVLLAQTETKSSPEIDKFLEDMKTAQDAHWPYKGLLVEKVENLGQALDAMLVANRYLKAYQADVRFEWLKDWQIHTARFEGNDAEGPDDNNPPVNTPDDDHVTAAVTP